MSAMSWVTTGSLLAPFGTMAAGDDKFLHGLINGLEDPRIEKKVIRLKLCW
jgi:hypothetical protein